jgi:DNA (cytosine-5)-methyltransferase 1
MTYFLDLFSGIGGFAKGAHDAGLRFDRHFFSEIDSYASKVYRLRLPEAEALGDIKAIRGETLPEGDWIIAGGFPCQDISVAGKGAGLDGARSGLWYEYARLIGKLRPKYAIMENVGAITFRGLDAVLGSLAEIGYDAEWQDIRASDVGAPHKRERIWIVAYPGCKHGKTRNAEELAASEEKRLLSTVSDKSISTGQDRFSRASAPGVNGMAHGIPCQMDRLKCLGNSIVPQIARLIFSQSAFDEWRIKCEVTG